MITAVGAFNDVGYTVARQTDGKLLVGGYSYNGTDNDFSLVRYNVGGTLDASFGNAGKVVTPVGHHATTGVSTNDEGHAIVVDGNGKILLAGMASNGTNWDFALVRYTSDGQLDTSFGVGTGIVTTSFLTFADKAYSVIAQADGKIVLAGWRYGSVRYTFALARYNSNGTLDNSFGIGGKVATPIGATDNSAAYAVAQQSSGKYVAGGTRINSTSDDFALVRYNTNGTLDTSFGDFGSNGIVITDVSGRGDYAYDLAIQTDNKILLAGESYNGTNYEYTVVRYLADGALDTTFGSGGKVITPLASPANANAVTVLADGKILVAGVTGDGTLNDFALVRYTPTGALDATFGGGDGIVTRPIGATTDNAYDMTVESDGKIVLVGETFNGTNYDFALAHYNADGSLITNPQAIVFGNAPTLAVGGSGTVSATGGSSGNPVVFTSQSTSVCTVSGATVSGVAAGTCTLAANQAGTTNYAAAPEVTQTFTVGLGSQTIVFGSAPTLAVGGSGTVSASGGNSGNPVVFTSQSMGVCTVSGTTVSGVATGTCTLAANQAGTTNYAAAPEVTQTFTVGLGSQTIVFGSAPTLSVGGSGSVNASGGNSGNPVVFTSQSMGVCTVSGTTVSGVATGTCTLAANQAGDTNYAAAPEVTQTFAVGLGSQTIVFGSAPTLSVGGSGSVNASGGNSGNPVVFTSQSMGVCTVSGTTVSGVATGTCTLAANQAGDTNYAAAPEVTQTFAVGLGSQTIVFGSPPTLAVGGSGSVSANGGNSGNPVVFASQTTGTCTVSGTTVTGVAVGNCTIAANQAGNTNYAAAPEVTQNINVTASTIVTGETPDHSGEILAEIMGGGCVFTQGRYIASPVASPLNVTLPYGLFEFTANGCEGNSVTIRLTYPAAMPSGTEYWKYQAESGWYRIPANFSSNTVMFTITDNGEGDDDPSLGVIADPGGPGFRAAVAAIPTLSHWGILILFGLLSCFGVEFLRRQHPRWGHHRIRKILSLPELNRILS